MQVANSVMQEANRLKEEILPDDVDLIVTRNSGIVANEKVNELIEALGVAIVIVVLLLTFGLGWREALIVSIAVPVVFGLTLAVNLFIRLHDQPRYAFCIKSWHLACWLTTPSSTSRISRGILNIAKERLAELCWKPSPRSEPPLITQHLRSS